MSGTVTPFRAGATGVPQPLVVTPHPDPHVLLADVSEFQPNVADAQYLSTFSKAIVIRCAYGDQHADGAWYGGQRRELLHTMDGGALFLGIYQYLVAGQDPKAQVQAMYNLVGKLQPHEVLIADAEEGDHGLLSSWYNEAEAIGYDPTYLWTYTGLNFGTANKLLPVEWLAAYQNAEPTSSHHLWQFTDAYVVPGIGTADCSLYHGTIEQLSALAMPAASPVSPPSNQTGRVYSLTTGGSADLKSADGGWTWQIGPGAAAGFTWQTGTIHSATTNADQLAVTGDGGLTWHYAGTPA
jgi:hypothetical protein